MQPQPSRAKATLSDHIGVPSVPPSTNSAFVEVGSAQRETLSLPCLNAPPRPFPVA